MGTFLLWGVLGTLGVVCIIGICRWLDRLLLRAEEKGWIYYRKKSAGGSSSGFVGSAMIELDRVIRPSAERIGSFSAVSRQDREQQFCPPFPRGQSDIGLSPGRICVNFSCDCMLTIHV